MREIILKAKTGFRVKNIDTPIIIRDFRGISFYNTEPLLPKVKVFNLPEGKYWLDSGHFERLPNPIKYPFLKVPRFERFRTIPRNFKQRFADNPNKCTIDWKRGTITFDNSLKEYSLPELDFIRYHEYSHARYKTEKFCDLMAVNFMLAKGYNPSQIGHAQIESLSDNAYDRKIFVLQKLIEYGKTQK